MRAEGTRLLRICGFGSSSSSHIPSSAVHTRLRHWPAHLCGAVDPSYVHTPLGHRSNFLQIPFIEGLGMSKFAPSAEAKDLQLSFAGVGGKDRRPDGS